MTAVTFIIMRHMGIMGIFRILIRNLSTSTHEYLESNCGSKHIMLLSNFGEENRGLSFVCETGFHHQLVLVPPIG